MLRGGFRSASFFVRREEVHSVLLLFSITFAPLVPTFDLYEKTESMNIQLKNIIAENLRRKRILADLSKAYNPFTGEGCSGERIPFRTSVGKTLYLLKSQVLAPDFNPDRPNDNRFLYDFEFWAASVFRICGQPLKFTLAHQSIIRSFVENPANGRFIIMHASSMGITSVCEAYILWRELFRFPCTDAVFCYSNAAQRKRFRRFCSINFRKNDVKFNVNPRSSKFISPNILSVNNNTSSVCFTVSRNPMAVNGLNLGSLLISDANSSVIADSRNFYALQNSDPILRKFQAYNSSSFIIIESNPDSPHLGGFFNNSFRKAVNIPPHPMTVRYRRPSWLKKGEVDNITPIRHSYVPPVISGFVPVFIPWYADEYKTRPLKSSVCDFWNSLSPHEYYLWEFYMCSLEQINWYRHASNHLYNTSPPKIYPSSQYEAIFNCFDSPKYYVRGKLVETDSFHSPPNAVIASRNICIRPVHGSSFRKHPLSAVLETEVNNQLIDKIQFLADSEIYTGDYHVPEISLVPN